MERAKMDREQGGCCEIGVKSPAQPAITAHSVTANGATPAMVLDGCSMSVTYV